MVFAAGWSIINDEKKILLIKRSNYTKVFPWFWAFPGGRSDSWELPEETVVREIKEEVWLDFEPKELLKISSYKDRKLYRYFWSWTWNINIQESEIDDYNWYTHEEALDLNLAFDYRDIINILHDKKLI